MSNIGTYESNRVIREINEFLDNNKNNKNIFSFETEVVKSQAESIKKCVSHALLVRGYKILNFTISRNLNISVLDVVFIPRSIENENNPLLEIDIKTIETN